jgi:hypothetical protein
MSPATFVESLIIGMNLFLLLVFLAWRFCGPGRPHCRETVPEASVPEETRISE